MGDGEKHRSAASAGLTNRTTLFGVAALLATAAVVGGGALAFGGGRPEWPQAVAYAATICLPGAVIGWIVARLPGLGPATAVAASLAATVLRIIPALAALAWLSTGRSEPVRTETASLLVVFYLALLATDILLHIMVGPTPQGGKPPQH